ncbi:MAG: HAD-IIIC family phosphatase [Caldilineaceae bacterium]
MTTMAMIAPSAPAAPANQLVVSKPPSKSVKCVVWDLDNTLWQGVLLEEETVTLIPGAVDVIKTLDERGILQSLASKNEAALALQKLREFGLEEYFLFPQINWGSKAASVEAIAQALNIGLDTLAFVDDQPFERDEVAFSLPVVRCIDAADLHTLPMRADMTPKFITRDSSQRRQMYRSDMARQEAEAAFTGPTEAFLASLDMVQYIFFAQEEDLQRAEELTVRTNQLNATGYTYSYDELNHFRQSPDYQLLMTSLDDTYGTYGNVGLALLACTADLWTIKLLLMSCRVMSRGVGSVMLTHILQQAKATGVQLQAEFVPTNRNRLMNITYHFAGFEMVEERGALQILHHNLLQVPSFPAYVTVITPHSERIS